MKGKILFAMGRGVGALMWYKKKNPDMLEDMKHGIKKAAQGIADYMD